MMNILRKIVGFLTHRLFVLLVIISVLFFVLVDRIFYLQIKEGAKLESEFSLNIIKSREIESQRGRIYDRNGYPLAENVIAYKVLLDGSIRVPDKNEMVLSLTNIIEKNGDKVLTTFPIDYDKDGTIVYTRSSYEVLQFKKNTFIFKKGDELSDKQKKYTAQEMLDYYIDFFELDDQELPYTDEEMLEILKIRYPLWTKRYFQFQQETIGVNLSKETVAELEENKELFPGISIVEDPQRQYNYSNYFAHIIGYTGKIDAETYKELEGFGYEVDDIVGKIGIEKEMERNLKGKDGEEVIEVDNLGRTRDVLDVKYPESGKDVYLTLDKDLQVMCYDILENQLAEVLQLKLSYNESTYSDPDKGVALVKDLFGSLFRNEKIDINRIVKAQEGTAANDIYMVFLDYLKDLQEKVDYTLDISTYQYNEELNIYFRYFLEKLLAEGYIVEDYKEYDVYKAYDSGDKTFYDLLNSLIELEVLKGNQETDKEQVREFVYHKIMDEYMHYYKVKYMLFLDLIEQEVFSYYDLCLLLIEQGIVTADEQISSDFYDKQGDTLGFLKAKIKNLELTPQELALDPNSGSVVITDVNSGEVLALVSYPSYDNNMLVNDFNYEYYSQLLNDPTNPLYPRATQTRTAPGSTFKMLSAIAGLEEGVIEPDEYIYATGLFDKVYPPAKCWIYDMGGMHGNINVSDALEVSCNHFFYEVGYRLSLDDNGKYIDAKGIKVFKEYAERLGLSTSTGIEIGDSYKNSVSEQYAVRTAIGQGANDFTPVQLARYIGTIANGGTCYELNVIDKVLYSDGRLFFEKTPSVTYDNEFEEENMEAVHYGMYKVLNGEKGTARYYMSDLPVLVAGKTGSAQQSSVRPSHGFFAGYASYDKPEISVVSMIRFGYGSAYATQMTQKIIQVYYDYQKEIESENKEIIELIDE